jgi:hypothetical protein
MTELAIPDFFISVFKKIFGEKANLMMCLLMFTKTEGGKKLMDQFSSSLDTPEGQKLLEEIQGVISSLSCRSSESQNCGGKYFPGRKEMSEPIIDLSMTIAILMNEAAGETLPKNFLAMEAGSSIDPYQFRSFLEKVIEKAKAS